MPFVVSILDAKTGAILKKIEPHHYDSMGRALYVVSGRIPFTPDGRYFLVDYIRDQSSPNLYIYDTRSLGPARALLTDGPLFRTLPLSPDGSYLLRRAVFDSADGRYTGYEMLDPWSGKVIRRVRAEGSADGIADPVVISPDGRNVLSGGRGTSFKTHELLTGSLVQTFSGHSYPIESAAYSPDGMYLVSCNGREAKVWDARTGACLATMPNRYGVTVAWSPDGKYIAVDGYAISVWEFRKKQN